MEMEIVVFHCALSQQRGPAAAERYVRAREKKLGEKSAEGGGKERGPGTEEGEREVEGGEHYEGEKKKAQAVYVLDGGFVNWQEK